VQGLDFIQVGVAAVAINARGFNSSFNNRMLMIEDGRISVLPENGLPVGQFTATPKVDLASMEVLVGPGSALYGADASSGVISLQTKDPRQFPGTTVEVTGGNRSYKDVQARHAGVLGNWGYKLSGEWQDANDWENYLAYTTNVPGRGTVRVKEDSIPGNSIDWRTNVARGSGALVYYMGESQLQFSGGASKTNGVGQTNVGRNQLRDWTYNFQQAQYSSPRFYLNAYRAQSQSGESFALNRYAGNYAFFPNANEDSLRLMSDWPSDGRMYAAEAQTNFRLPVLLNTAVVVGSQFRQDVVSSDRQWLTDRLTGEDISVDQFGFYGQTTTPVSRMLDVVLAARLDDHENYARQFSPKAGVVFKLAPGQAFRVTYNRAFKSPTILQTNFHIPDWTSTVSIYGNTQGFSIRDADGAERSRYEPLRPEENQTWEVGYKGLIANRLFVDLSAYRSTYQDFLSPLAIISDPFGLGLAGDAAGVRSFAHDADGNRINHPLGYAPLVLTYYNLGEAKLRGADLGVNFVVTPKISVKSTVSLVDLQEVEVPTNRAEAVALNSPTTKWTLGGTFNDLAGFQGGATVRHVNGYYFRSGINTGVVPTFSTLDLNTGYRIRQLNSTLNLGVSNLFTCGNRDDFTYAATGDPLRTTPLNKDRACGFGRKHQEMINMPQIGTMVFIGLRYDLPR
ncbi:MAG: TonB-dependent receptor, partial [Gemmatimonadota bacterium]|nr:TonB-dependent receptor [Gemmatimonadota bacterium]